MDETARHPPAPSPGSTAPTVQVDIISDVMCPWCIVGFKQLELALAQTGMGARVRWHPFELNPDMGPEGENLAAHIQRKYGSTPDDSARARAQLQDIGAALGFRFALGADSRIVNSFAAHCLLDFAAGIGLQHPLKLALFAAHFSEQKDVSTHETLLDCAQAVGIDRESAAAALGAPHHARSVRAQQQVWAQNGISGVPTMIFAETVMVTGAQGPRAYADILRRVHAQAA